MADYISQIQLSDNLIYDITLPGLIATVDQLNSLSGVTQDLQTQLNNKWDKETDTVSIEAASAGDITNETVMTITVTDRGKIKTVYGVSFGPSTSGGPANFHCGVTQGDTTTTLTVTLAGVAISDNAWNAYWTLPVTLNFDAF